MNPMTKVATAKASVMGVWESPSDATMKQVAEAKAELSAAIKEANAFLAKVRPMSQTLSPYGATLSPPAGTR